MDWLLGVLSVVFSTWFRWSLLCCAMPVAVVTFIYLTSFYLQAYQYIKRQPRQVLAPLQVNDGLDSSRAAVSALWRILGKIWHGYQVTGIENVPTEGAAMLVWYHGPLPIDIYYLSTEILAHRKRSMWCVCDKFLLKVPGLPYLLRLMRVGDFDLDKCQQLLQKGQLLSLGPGGTREALFSDGHYTCLWNNRLGFAKLALKADVPIIPVFTTNTREAFRPVSTFSKFFREVYERTRLPLIPLYGGLPVKLHTFIGKPLRFEAGSEPSVVSAQVQTAIRELIASHQHTPGSFYEALKQRIWSNSTHQRTA